MRHTTSTERAFPGLRKYSLPKGNFREFRGVDGEGGNVEVDDGGLFPATRHEYLSLRVGPELLETGKPLTHEDILPFLADQPHKYLYVSYFFDYDVTMIIRTLPVARARRLLHPELRERPETGFRRLPVDVGDFQIDYLPHKEFRVRRKPDGKWVVINDVGQFFQTSFLKTLERWDTGTEVERAFIKRGKEMRHDFADMTDEIRAYNALECQLLRKLMTDFRDVCEEVGYIPKKWQGPGHLASAMLEYHGIPKRDDIPIMKNQAFYSLALAAYYGGRFEITATGPIYGPCYQYDINGAYVHMLRTLPCLIHGSWKLVRERPAPGKLWFGQIHYEHDKSRLLFNFPHRLKNGDIQYRRKGIGVYWSTEIEAAERAGSSVDFSTGWEYETHCECKPFDFIDDYYQKRLALGKSAKGYVLKLAGNSLYGKLAQSIGYAPWANPVWAGIITAGCRAMLIDAYSQDPDGTYMLATDGIFCSKQLDLPVSKELGEWDLTVHKKDSVFIVQPGIYFTGEDIKTRGVEHVRIEKMRGVFEMQFYGYLDNPKGQHYGVKVPVVNFISAPLALARNRWETAGRWEETEREISFYWGGKRKPGIARFDDNGTLRTYPYDGSDPPEYSQPYSKRIGGNIREREGRYSSASLQQAEWDRYQPDWADPVT